jgi:phage shock protein C
MNLADELKKLDQLHLSGSLTDEEFARAKYNLLYASTPMPPRTVLSNDEVPHPQEFSLKSLTRSRLDSWFGGVCGGLGQRGPLPVWAWRCLFAMAFMCYGIGLIPYIMLWVFVPNTPITEHSDA